jgi:hypothetical protein
MRRENQGIALATRGIYPGRMLDFATLYGMLLLAGTS